ncbi:hypothetical protein AX14_014440 [Amanita brunnescens Koide BX004]|nr:hypothetical protein AX14_014440 [Amanita brunnescens Koide BX004]
MINKNTDQVKSDGFTLAEPPLALQLQNVPCEDFNLHHKYGTSIRDGGTGTRSDEMRNRDGGTSIRNGGTQCQKQSTEGSNRKAKGLATWSRSVATKSSVEEATDVDNEAIWIWTASPLSTMTRPSDNRLAL